MTMFRSDKKIPDFSGTIAAGGEANFDLPVGPVYHNLRVETNIPAQHLIFELELNGEVIWKLTGTQLNTLDEFYRVPSVENILNFRIGQDQFNDASNTALTGLVTLAGDNVYLKVRVGGHSVLSPYLKIYGQTNPDRAVREFIPRFKPVHIPITTTGENEYQWKRQGRGAGDLQLSAVHFFGAVTKCHIEQDGYTQFELPKNVNDAALTQSVRDRRAPVDGYYHLDFVREGYARDMFDTYSEGGELMFKLTTTNSTDVTALVHSIERVKVAA